MIMKKKAGGKKDGKALSAYYMELESPLDLTRRESGNGPGSISAIKNGGVYRLLSYGEKLGDLRIVYYADVEKISNFLVYNPGSDSKEGFEIVGSVPGGYDFKSYKFPIMELASDPYTEAKDFKKADKIIKVQAKDPDSLIRSIVSQAHEDESVPRLYAFFNGKEHIIGTFGLFHESDAKIFIYSVTEIKKMFSALSYNYTDDKIEPVDSFTEKSLIYIRVINLKKPFPFF
jgi:hypothetical protein